MLRVSLVVSNGADVDQVRTHHGTRRQHPHLLKADVELIVATVFDRITDALVRGDRVELRGFGAFTVKRRNARIGRNPRTGARLPWTRRHGPFFKTGRELRERLNSGGMKPSRVATTLTR